MGQRVNPRDRFYDPGPVQRRQSAAQSCKINDPGPAQVGKTSVPQLISLFGRRAGGAPPARTRQQQQQQHGVFNSAKRFSFWALVVKAARRRRRAPGLYCPVGGGGCIFNCRGLMGSVLCQCCTWRASARRGVFGKGG